MLLAKANHLSNPASPVSKFDYDIPLPNGTPSGLGANAIGQRATVKTTGTAFPVLPRWTWAYDSMGQLTSAAHSATAAHSRYYAYDTIGNRRESRTGTATPSGGTLTSYYATADGSNVPGANSRNQYAAINSVKPIHDADGNMTSGPIPTTTSLRTLVWDAENRLTEVKYGTTTLVRYHYDAAGRRIAAIASGVTTLHLYDGWNPIAEYAGQTLTRTYLWGMDLSGSIQGAGGVGGLLAVRVHSTGAATYYPTYDGNGNVSEYLNASGVIKAHYEYDPFGNTLSVANLATEDTTLKNALAHRFSTKPRDAVTGLYYYGYRWYDPVTGRWPSRDPIGEDGGVNLYGFTENDDINYFDDLGHHSSSPGHVPFRGRSGPSSPVSDPTIPIRVAFGLIGSILDGDAFSKEYDIPSFKHNQCEFLITATGINNNGTDHRIFNKGVSKLPAFKGIPNSGMINNPTRWRIGGKPVGDYVQILLNETLFAVTITELRMVRQIEAAAAAAKKNGCCCWYIHVVAHSQGTMTFRRALPLIAPEVRKHIGFTGLGGETGMAGDGLAYSRNIVEKDDPVPTMSPSWGNIERHVFDDKVAAPGVPSHAFDKVYIPRLESDKSLLNHVKRCK